jgi:peptide/nickel transport system ATP-binding protein
MGQSGGLAAMTDLLNVRDLKVDFTVHGDQLRAVDGVSFRIRQGGTTALVGASGSGKSVCSQAIMGILPNIGSIAGGEILFTDPRGDGTPVDLARLERDGKPTMAVTPASCT